MSNFQRGQYFQPQVPGTMTNVPQLQTGGDTRYRYPSQDNRRDRRFEPYGRNNNGFNNNPNQYQQRNHHYNNQQYRRGGRMGGRGGYNNRRNHYERKPYENPEVKARRIEKERIESQKRRKGFKVSSRWHTEDSQYSHVVPPFPTFIPFGLPSKALDALLTRARLDEISRRLQIGLTVNRAEMREPSPEPIFDVSGRRTNTRIERLKEELNRERSVLIEKAFRICPSFKPPEGFKFEPRKYVKKLSIPVEKYPGYNFIGLIIGPRGSTQKRLEEETGAKIAIRGKGSVKGIKAEMNPVQDEPLHVLITADNERVLHKAVDVIEKLLVPIEEGRNEFKRRQLRELAKIHGTLREEPDNLKGGADVSLVKQLQNYGDEPEPDEDDDDDEDSSDRRRRKTNDRGDSQQRRGWNNYNNPNASQMNEEEKDEIFERFVQELEGQVQSVPFYHKLYEKKKKKKKKKSVVAPGVKGIKRSHYLYCEQVRKDRKKERDDVWGGEEGERIARHFGFDDSAVVDFDDNDPNFECLFIDNPVAPPGTLEEEVLQKVMEQKRSVEKKEKLMKKLKKTLKIEKDKVVTDEVKKEKTLQEVLQNKKEMDKRMLKKKQKIVLGDIPPWEIDDDSDDEDL